MDFKKVNNKLFENLKKNDYQGYDPFDFLNSKFFKNSPLNNFYFFRLIWTQIGKRLPFNIRKIIKVPMGKNPKGIALIIQGHILNYKTTKQDYFLQEATKLAYWLLRNTCDSDVWEYPCWGYNFDWQARAFFLKKGTPNIIVTVYVSMALYELGKISNNNEFINNSLNSALFINKFLLEKKDNFCFYKYVPHSKTFVHNANLWGSYWCFFSGQVKNNIVLKDVSIKCAKLSIKHQNQNGSWDYGTRSHHKFIDGFHTGFNLEALYLLNKSYNSKLLNKVIDKGYQFYIKNLIDDNGIAKYFDNKVFPIDSHSFSQAIITILKIKDYKNSKELTQKILKKFLQVMYIEKEGRFRYQVNKYFRNNINYLRWSQAWSYYAISLYLNKVHEKD